VKPEKVVTTGGQAVDNLGRKKAQKQQKGRSEFHEPHPLVEGNPIHQAADCQALEASL
jgi:hypothetical protein